MKDNFYSDLYYDLLISYNIIIYDEYKFIYDNFLEHLISDTEILVKKNYKSSITEIKLIDYKCDINIMDYLRMTFKGCFYRHFANSEWGNKLIHPDKYPELKRKLRVNKLKKILNNGSM